VFAFNAENKPLFEVQQKDADITWSVQLTNSKSAFWKFSGYTEIIGNADPHGVATTPHYNELWKAKGFRNPSIQKYADSFFLILFFYFCILYFVFFLFLFFLSFFYSFSFNT
jgi:hypothetical protein